MRVLQKLSAVLLEERDALLAEWRAKVLEIPAARKLDMPALNDHMPRFVMELATALRKLEEGSDGEPYVASPPAHGCQRFEDGFDIEEVVAEYNVMRTSVLALAERRGVAIQGALLRLVNDVLDHAIGAAVKHFAERQAAEVQRRREEYLAFVAHDLRTPLNAITLATHVLELRWPDGGPDPDTSRMMRTLRRNAGHLKTLVDRVLDENTHLLTELGVKLERRRFDLWPLVEGVMHDVQPMAIERRTALVNQVPDDLTVDADAGLVRRIFQNLLSNAIGYTAGGVVTIGARGESADGPVECWVADNGDGIPPERLSTVFEALETDPERDGVGLGLAIVKTFVEAHDGRVSVESEPGKGCVFRFTLPRSAGAPESPGDTRSP
ncbi:MAG TPA: sensor histidine kinase [Usitatibacter sp.]|jgi:signal transduction histidine kinase|nr:sensor histidine kinase [Usitatibacter sp.]